MRRELIEQHPWVEDVDVELAGHIFEPMLSAMDDANRALDSLMQAAEPKSHRDKASRRMKAIADRKVDSARALAQVGFGASLTEVNDLMQVVADLCEYYCFQNMPSGPRSRL
jgi:hypothetical protein